MNAIKSGLASQGSENIETIQRIEEAIKRIVSLNQKVTKQSLMEELEHSFQNIRDIEMAVYNLVKREEFIAFGENSKFLQRKK